MIIKDASYFTMTERGRLAFLQYKDKTSRIPSTLEEMEFPSMQRRTIALPGEPYHQHNRRQASLALLLWTISMMGIYGVAIERHRRETNPLDTALPPKAAATCAAMIGAQTTGLFTAAIYAEQFMTTYNTGLPPTIQTRAMQAGTLLAMTIIANSLYSLSNRLKAPKIGSFLRLINYMRHGKPADWKSQTESYNSTYLEVGPIENEIMLSKEDILNGNYESARIHSYNAVERCGMASILPEYSFFHALISKINESIDEAQARLDSQGANPQRDRRYWNAGRHTVSQRPHPRGRRDD